MLTRRRLLTGAACLALVGPAINIDPSVRPLKRIPGYKMVGDWDHSHAVYAVRGVYLDNGPLDA